VSVNKVIGSLLPLVGRIFTPAAMVVFLTYEITRSQPVGGWWQVAVVIGAAATAIGVEVVGILSGHALEVSWRIKDGARSVLALILLLIYTLAGMWLLRQNATLMPVPVIAAIVYLAAALVEGLETAVRQRSDHTETQQVGERSQAEQDRQAERERQAAEDQRRHEENLRRMELQAQATAAREAEETARLRIAAEERRRNAEQRRRRAEERRAETQPAPQTVADASQPLPSAAAETQPAMPYECECGKVYEKPQAYSAHTRHCAVHKEFIAKGNNHD
jgi:hypothetical protein